MLKRIFRLLLLVIAIMIGGILGYILLTGFEIYRMCVFGVACIILGRAFHTIDKIISLKE